MGVTNLLAREQDVKGKVILITGAARGFGAGLAKRFAARGAKVALVGLEPDVMKKVAAECGPDAAVFEADVTDWAALETATKGVVERFGGIDIVVANAGIAAAGFVRSIDPKAFERTIEVDLLGVWRTVRVTLPHVIDRKGYILVVSSLAAITHAPAMAAYAAAKAGVEAFTNSLRAEMRHLGVRVGVAHPSWIATDLVNGADEHPVFGPLRASMPGPMGKTYPVEFALDALEKGILRRDRSIHVPGWVGALKLVRTFLPPIIEIGAKLRGNIVAKADKAALEDIAKRGAEASSRPVGAGGQADAEAR
ncbi:NADP-dependent 3-hydroxy acid dehydrogenase YdfG [Actinokineospora alba]|uniref:NADP-dependent 3-hydroxy acid dehydrogenase YdfG n=1 Tax=Actinokineospora alba TaxID=504798 RepID=A0A1H0PU15_9PSEU|nr:SDR family oxidoreductase [Actinokineospora alba]TDP65948.1 NADP-dependent 3-hydroxy acid dehydrogenase YdfG [Actinokineospora alba]SDI61518.1 NADP-dependent 3-hydroxy acid dehydrogenase YdfG [Actinokineospora alba]SDP08657.1 NADP-dependent 3-hydroxy acid dehydrogenase YdfG [Actinokineospora alba]